MKSKWYIYLIIGAIFIFIYFNYVHKTNEDIIKEQCTDCVKFEEIKKTNWILVFKSDGLTNLWDTKTKDFILNNWYIAVYDDGVIYDDITFTVNGESIIVSDTDYSKLAKLKDDYFSKNDDELDDDVIHHNCSICKIDFTGNGYGEDDYGEIVALQDPHIGDKCSFTCANQAKQESDEAYEQISQKYGIDMNTENNSSNDNPGGYHIRNDGRVYENKKCELCRGSGFEKGMNAITGDVDSRICPMCEGKGVRSY